MASRPVARMVAQSARTQSNFKPSQCAHSGVDVLDALAEPTEQQQQQQGQVRTPVVQPQAGDG